MGLSPCVTRTGLCRLKEDEAAMSLFAGGSRARTNVGNVKRELGPGWRQESAGHHSKKPSWTPGSHTEADRVRPDPHFLPGKSICKPGGNIVKNFSSEDVGRGGVLFTRAGARPGRHLPSQGAAGAREEVLGGSDPDPGGPGDTLT